MASVTFQTSEGAVTVTYQLAQAVARVKTFVANMGYGQWLGDMGDKYHQWNDGVPSHGRRYGDHTAWSADGPAGVVKAFDWKPFATPAGKIAFKPWLVKQLKAGRYKTSCKFVNVGNEQYSGYGNYQGHSSDIHLHWSYLPDAINSTANPIADYYNEVIAEVDVELTDPMDSYVGFPTTVGKVLASAYAYSSAAAADAKAANITAAGNKATLATVLAQFDAEVQRDADEAARDAEELAELRAARAEILAAVAAVEPGNTEAFDALLARIRVVLEPTAPTT